MSARPYDREAAAFRRTAGPTRECSLGSTTSVRLTPSAPGGHCSAFAVPTSKTRMEHAAMVLRMIPFKPRLSRAWLDVRMQHNRTLGVSAEFRGWTVCTAIRTSRASERKDSTPRETAALRADRVVMALRQRLEFDALCAPDNPHMAGMPPRLTSRDELFPARP